MKEGTSNSELIDLLNVAVARELQVSIQYMFQHSRATSRVSTDIGRASTPKQVKFAASHSLVFLPGASLKKIAIAEMRHAEAIAERVVALGGEPTTTPGTVIIGTTAKDMLENDREQERGAIELYRRIVGVAAEHDDEETAAMFKKILADEERHHKVFSDLLAEG